MQLLLMLFFAIYPIADSFTFSEDMGMATVTGGLLLAAAPFLFIKWKFISKQPLGLSVPMMLLIPFVGFCALTGLWAYHQLIYQSGIIALGQTLALLLVADVFTRDQIDVDRMLQAYVIGTLALAGFIAYDYITGALYVNLDMFDGEIDEFGDQRYSVAGTDPNGKALQMAIGMALILGHAGFTRSVMINYSLAGVLLIGVILTGSRTGFVACAIILSAYMLYESKITYAIRKWFVAMFSLAVFYGFWDFDSSSISLDRISKMLEEGADTDLSGREALWANAFNTYLQHPLLGIGYNTFMEYSRDVFGRALVAHNTHLSIMAQTGSVGYLLFLFVYGLVPFYWLKLKNLAVKRTYLGVFAALFTGSMTLDLSHLFTFWVFILLMERSLNSRTEGKGVLTVGAAHRNPEIEKRLEALRKRQEA